MKAFFSFRETLIVNFILVALIPILLTGLISLHIFTGYLEKEILSKNSLTARSVSGQIGLFLNEPKDVLRRVAAMIEGGGLSNRDLFRASLESIISNYPVFRMIQVLDHVIIGRNTYYSFADDGLIARFTKEFERLSQKPTDSPAQILP